MSTFQWNTFPWEALATVFTGLAAVAAATFVGLKQTKIAQNQSKIEENKLKFDLFDRRMRIADVHSKLVSLSIGGSQRAPFVAEFMDRRGEVRFLFDDNIARLFDQAYDISVDIDMARSGGTSDEFHAARAAASQNLKEFLDAATPYLAIGR